MKRKGLKLFSLFMAVAICSFTPIALADSMYNYYHDTPWEEYFEQYTPIGTDISTVSDEAISGQWWNTAFSAASKITFKSALDPKDATNTVGRFFHYEDTTSSSEDLLVHRADFGGAYGNLVTVTFRLYLESSDYNGDKSSKIPFEIWFEGENATGGSQDLLHINHSASSFFCASISEDGSVNASSAANTAKYVGSSNAHYGKGEWRTVSVTFDFDKNKVSGDLGATGGTAVFNDKILDNRETSSVWVKKITGLRIRPTRKTKIYSIYLDDIVVETSSVTMKVPAIGDYPAWSEISDETKSAVTQDLNLPGVYTDGDGNEYSIAWSSNKGAIINPETGVVNRGLLGLDTDVALTASFTPTGAGDPIDDYTYNVRVLAQENDFIGMDFENSRALDATVNWDARDSLLSLDDGWSVAYSAHVSGTAGTTSNLKSSAAIELDPKDYENRVISVSREEHTGISNSAAFTKIVNDDPAKLNGVVYVSFRIYAELKGRGLQFTINSVDGDRLTYSVIRPTYMDFYENEGGNIPSAGAWENSVMDDSGGAKWHNITFRFDFAKNRKDLYVDGQKATKVGSSDTSGMRIDRDVAAWEPTEFALGSVGFFIQRDTKDTTTYGATKYYIDDIVIREAPEYPFVYENGKIYKVDDLGNTVQQKAFAALYAPAPNDNELQWLSVTDLGRNMPLNTAADVSLENYPQDVESGYKFKIFGFNTNTLNPAMRKHEEVIE